MIFMLVAIPILSDKAAADDDMPTIKMKMGQICNFLEYNCVLPQNAYNCAIGLDMADSIVKACPINELH